MAEVKNDNLKTTFVPDTDNLATSDELSPIMDNSSISDSSYAKRKRAAKITQLSLITISIVLIGGGTAMTIGNAFITAPNISSLKIEAIEGGISYSFKIKNDRNYKTYFEVKPQSGMTYKLDVKSSKLYEGEINDIGYNVKVKWKFHFTNGLDYTKSIKEGSLYTGGN